jgi:EAL domain-containing protein (putative c-di-GMP-specific phosphodiesterase class I)/GGDEF domain-containing protein
VPKKNDRIEVTALIESIAAIPGNANSVSAALEQALEAVCKHSPVVFGRAQIHSGTPDQLDRDASEIWTSSLPDRRSDPLRRAIQSEPPLSADRAGETGCRNMRLAGATVDPVEGAARKAGMSSVIYLDVHAEDKPAASLQLFTDRVLKDADELFQVFGLLVSQLEQIAGRDRMRQAVRAAAQHTRRQTAELEMLAIKVESQDSKIEKLEIELSELEAETQIQSYRSRNPGDSQVVRSLADEALEAEPPDETTEVLQPEPARAPNLVRDLYDSRTELPNREILEDRIDQAIRRRQRSPKNLFAVLAVSAEGLDRVAVESGQEGLDVLTTALSRRLLAQVRNADTVAHLDDATFVLVLEEIRVLDEALRISERIVKELQRPIWSGSTETQLGVRVGIVFGGPAYDRARSTIRDAVSALTRSRISQTPVAVFDEAAQHEEEIHRRIEVELGQALAEDQLYLEYQPIVSLQDGRIDGIEAFLRWRHPEHGMVPPDQFIPIAAQSPLIHDLGVWLLERTCEQVNAWQKALSRTIPTIDLNVTARQLFHERTAGRVKDIVARHGLRCEQFRFDIPESELMQNPAAAAAALEAIRGLGFRVAIDDFGTGFSSLRLLHGMPIDAIKIDRAFVSGGKGTDNLAVARTIVQLARSLEAEVIAEGVETRDQFRFLKSIGCGKAQGYLFSAPVKPSRIVELIREGYPLEQGQT